MKLSDYEGWLWLIVALVWLLPLVGVIVGSVLVHTWIATVAVALVGIGKLQK